MPTTPADRLRATMAAALDQYERDTTPTATDTDYDDPLSRSYLRHLAKHLERTRTGTTAPDNLTALIADDFTLADARILRAAAEAVATATPAIVLKHAGSGMTAPGIAREIGLTESRVYGILRDQRKKEAQAIIAAGAAADPDPRASYEKYEKALGEDGGGEVGAAFLDALRGALPDETEASTRAGDSQTD